MTSGNEWLVLRCSRGIGANGQFLATMRLRSTCRSVETMRACAENVAPHEAARNSRRVIALTLSRVAA